MPLESRALGRTGKTPKQSGALTVLRMAALALLLMAIGTTASAQVVDPRAAEAYRGAISQVRIADRIVAMERFVSAGQGGPLQLDALELLIWDQLRIGSPAQAARTASRLLNADRDNPLALAAVSDPQVTPAGPQSLDMAFRGLNGLEGLRKPQGMADSEFSILKQQVAAMLSGAAGLGQLQAQEAVSARGYLRRAIAFFPDNPQYVYALGLADLSGPNPDTAEGFWLLARAVNLTRGTPAGYQISEYARSKYLAGGGTGSQWDQFLAAARTAKMPASYAAVTQTRAAPTVATAKKPEPKLSRAPKETAGDRGERRTASRKATENGKSKKSRASKRAAAEEEEAALTKLPDVVTPPPRPRPVRPVVKPGAPVSIGILVESGKISRSSRNAMVYGLSEMVRRLRAGDEAFIMSFSDRLDFEQDLTGNYRLLEEAMDHIKPQAGNALYDAVSFGAGHLKRIAKNPNRVLLVISDGRVSDSHTSPLQVAADIGGIRIYCIGMEVDGANARNLLSNLAAHTGGQASFISDTRQFHVATEEIAESLGIGKPF